MGDGATKGTNREGRMIFQKVVRKTSSVANLGVYLFLLFLVIFFSIITDGFLNFDNIINIIRQIAITGVAAFGEAFVLIVGGIDLSIGSIVGLSGVTSAILIRDLSLSVPLAFICGVLAGTLVGVLNGVIVTRLRVPPIIATLGTMTIVRGLSNLVAGGMSVFGMPETFRRFGRGYVWFLPIPVIIMIVVFFILFIMLNKMPFGRYVYAIGNNENSAIITGIDIPRMKMLVFVISGTTAGIAGVLLASRLDCGQAVPYPNFELDVITAVVLGGISIMGGKGKLIGVFIGVLIMGVLENGLILMNVLFYSQMVIKGPVLLLALGLDILSQRSIKFVE